MIKIVRYFLLSLLVTSLIFIGNTVYAADINVHISQVDTSSCPAIKSIVIVTDTSNNPIGDLTGSNFTVKEDSVIQLPITVTSVSQTSADISVALCLDYSGSMSSTAISDMENAAISFINNMADNDAGEIIKFADGVKISHAFTVSKDALINAVQGDLNLSTSATSLYDSIYQAVLDSSMRSGRKAVIAMTDGDDNNSVRSYSDVINLAIKYDVPVFTIGLGASINESVLQNIADETRGIYFEAPDSSDLQAIYESISQVLNNQYIVSYQTAAIDGQEHELEIMVTSDTDSGSDITTFISCGPFDDGIYIDQVNGTNNSTTIGSAIDPFKSITYAMLTMAARNTPDPWVVHIRAGIYDSDPDKPSNEREIFPIELRDGITFQGDTGAANCILSGAFIPESQTAIIKGENLNNIIIKGLTIRDMYRTGGSVHGAGCELINCTGVIQGCVIKNNRCLTSLSYGYGSGFWLSIPEGGIFNIMENIFKGNGRSASHRDRSASGGGFYVSGNYSGNISGNTFSKNSSYDHPAYGGGFFLNGNCSGDIKDNSFIQNYSGSSHHSPSSGGGFYISGIYIGNITGNNFNGNMCWTSGYKSTGTSKGGGFCVDNNFSGNITANTFNENYIVAWQPSHGGGFFVRGSFNGQISENTFNKNSSRTTTGYNAASCGGGFYIMGDLSGYIEKNCFNDNYVNSSGGGFYLNGKFSGDIKDNSFIRNSAQKVGGGFYISEQFNGYITGNIFCSNIAESSSCFILNYDGSVSNSTLVGNNFFLYNELQDETLYESAGIYSRQDITVVNNTFYGGNVDEYQVGISSNAAESVIKNNIFANLDTAIWEEDEQDLVITNNSYHNLQNILYRNNQSMGNDSDFLDLLLSNYNNNSIWDPGIAGESVDTGEWSQSPYYDKTNNCTILTDSNKNWADNQWVGAMLNISNIPNSRWHYKIVSNTEHQILIQGNIEITGLGRVATDYAIDDYRLAAGSQNIDAGIVTGIVKDFKGTQRPQGGAFDIGADEFFTGQTPPAISPASPGATSVTTESAVLRADINPNGLATTGYFEYGTTTGYGTTASSIDIGADTAIHTVSVDILGLDPDTTYHFRFRAENSAGETLGLDQTFETARAMATISGNISISIAGHTGLAAANATVSLKGTGYSAVTGADGQIIIDDVAPGTYVLVVEASYMTTVEQPVILTEGQNFVLNLPAQPGITQADIAQAVADAEAAKDAVIAAKNQEIATLNSTIASMFTQEQLDQALSDAEGAKDAVIEQKDQQIAELNTTISSMYTQEQMDQAITRAISAFDVNNDGKIGLPEAINALQIGSGLR